MSKYNFCILMLVATACASEPQKPAELIDNSNIFYGRNTSANKNNSSSAQLSSPHNTSTISESEYYHGEDYTVDTGNAVISTKTLTPPNTLKKTDSSKGEIKPLLGKTDKASLKWQNQETELEKSYKKTTHPSTNAKKEEKIVEIHKKEPQKSRISPKKENILSEKSLTEETKPELAKKPAATGHENPLKKALDSESKSK